MARCVFMAYMLGRQNFYEKLSEKNFVVLIFMVQINV